MAIFMKICEKNFLTHFLGCFWLIETKIKDEDEIIWKNLFNFWILHIEIELQGTFHENLRKMDFFSEFLPEDILGQKCQKG